MNATDSFKIVVEGCGFTDVKIKEARLPRHIISWARGDDTEMTDNEVAETIPYFRISTRQGSFGIAIGAYNLLDVKDTGFNAMDLGEEDADENFFLARLNDVTLKHLYSLLNSVKIH